MVDNYTGYWLEQCFVKYWGTLYLTFSFFMLLYTSTQPLDVLIFVRAGAAFQNKVLRINQIINLYKGINPYLTVFKDAITSLPALVNVS